MQLVWQARLMHMFSPYVPASFCVSFVNSPGLSIVEKQALDAFLGGSIVWISTHAYSLCINHMLFYTHLYHKGQVSKQTTWLGSKSTSTFKILILGAENPGRSSKGYALLIYYGHIFIASHASKLTLSWTDMAMLLLVFVINVCYTAGAQPQNKSQHFQNISSLHQIS